MWHIAMRPGKRRLLEAGSAVALAEREVVDAVWTVIVPPGG